MPVFDSKNLDCAFEGQALLASILHPTRAALTRALRHGRRRAERAAAMADPMTIESRFPLTPDVLAQTACSTR